MHNGNGAQVHLETDEALAVSAAPLSPVVTGERDLHLQRGRTRRRASTKDRMQERIDGLLNQVYSRDLLACAYQLLRVKDTADCFGMSIPDLYLLLDYWDIPRKNARGNTFTPEVTFRPRFFYFP